MQLKLLTDLTGYQEQVEELRQSWLQRVLLVSGVEEDLLTELSQSDLFYYLIHNDYEISHYPRLGATEVVLGGEVIGEWGGPEFEVKYDEKNKPYFEISIECWDISEEEEYD